VKDAQLHAGSEPEKGASAIHVLAKKILDLEALADLSVGTTVNTCDSGGTHPYVVPAEAKAVIDIRVPTLAERDRMLRDLKMVVERIDLPGTQSNWKESSIGRPWSPLQHRHPSKNRGGGMPRVEIPREVVAHRWSFGCKQHLRCRVPVVDGMGRSEGMPTVPRNMWMSQALYQKIALLGAVLDRLVGKESVRRRQS